MVASKATTSHNRKILSALVLLAATTGGSLAQAAETADPWDGNWHSTLTLYGWLPGVSADLRFKAPGGDFESKSDTDIFNNLSGFLMVRFDQRKGDWGWTGDLDVVKFSNEKGRFRQIGGDNIGGDANLDTRWNLKGGMFTLAGTYALSHSQSGYTDLLFGGRYLWIKGNLNWDFGLTGNNGFNIANSGHLAQNDTAFDAVIGLRGKWYLGDGNWYVPYYGDIGAGTNSTSTAQVDVGIGYRFGWGDMSLDYRSVWYNQDSASQLVKNLQLAGPSFNVSWHF